MRRLFLAALSLWVVWAIRAHAILTMPAFVDESLHIMRAQVVYEFTDEKASFLPAKLLLYYYFGLFNPQDDNGLWLSRQALALVSLLAAALSFALVKTFTRSYWKSLLVIWLYGLTPLLIFFERLAMSDPFVTVFALALVWSSVLFARHPTPRRAVITGLLLGFTLLAKLTALPLAIVPLLAVYLFTLTPNPSPLMGEGLFPPLSRSGRGGGEVRDKLQSAKPLLLCYIVAALMLLPFVGYMVYREVNPPDEKPEVVDSWLITPENLSRLEQMGYNIETYNESLRLLIGPLTFIFLLALAASFLSQNHRPKIYLLLITAAAWGFILVVSAFPSTRYLILGFPFLLIFTAVFLLGYDARQPHVQLLYLFSLVGFIAFLFYSIHFIAGLWDNPTRLFLSKQDQWEYFSHTSSGYGLREAVPDILALPEINGEIPLTGFVGNCHSLRLYFPKNHDVNLNCPYFKFNESMIPEVVAKWEQEVAETGSWYFLVEDAGIIDFRTMNVTPELISSYARPHDGVRVWLYRVTPGEGNAWFIQ